MNSALPRGYRWALGAGVAGLALLITLAMISPLAAGLATRAEATLAARMKSKALEVNFQAETEVNFFTSPHLVFNGVELYEQGKSRTTPAASFDRLEVGIEILPLFWGEVIIQTMQLQGSVLTLVQRPDASLGLTLQQTDGREGAAPFAVEVHDASLRIVDPAGTQLASAKQCDFTSSALSIAANHDFLPARLSFDGSLSCAELRGDKLLIADPAAEISVRNGFYEVDLQARSLRNAQQPASAATSADDPPSNPESDPDPNREPNRETNGNQGHLQADFTSAQPRYHLRYQLTGFDIEPFLKGRWNDVLVKGQIDLVLDVQVSGNHMAQLKRSANGRILIRGQGLKLEGIDLDRWLTEIERSQGFGVVDIGAVIFGGPFGLVLSQAYDFATLANKTPGQSQVQQLVSDWVIKDGVAAAQDVAFATAEHRLAVQGNINLVEERYEGLTVALITPEGCSILKQEIEGPIDNPHIEAVNVLKRVAAPVVKLLKEVQETFTHDDCDVIYTGAVVSGQ